MADEVPKITKQKHQRELVRRDDVVYYERPTITLKETKKFFTKEELKDITDEDLMRIIRNMKQIAEYLVDGKLVPQKVDDMV